jgi:hypothetical protein
MCLAGPAAPRPPPPPSTASSAAEIAAMTTSRHQRKLPHHLAPPPALLMLANSPSSLLAERRTAASWEAGRRRSRWPAGVAVVHPIRRHSSTPSPLLVRRIRPPKLAYTRGPLVHRAIRRALPLDPRRRGARGGGKQSVPAEPARRRGAACRCAAQAAAAAPARLRRHWWRHGAEWDPTAERGAHRIAPGSLRLPACFATARLGADRVALALFRQDTADPSPPRRALGQKSR